MFYRKGLTKLSKSATKALPRYAVIDARYLDPWYWSSGASYLQYCREIYQVSDELYFTQNLKYLALNILESNQSIEAAHSTWIDREQVSIKEVVHQQKECCLKVFGPTSSSRMLETALELDENFLIEYKSAIIYGSPSRKKPDSELFDKPIEEAMLLSWACIRVGLVEAGAIGFVSPQGKLSVSAKRVRFALLHGSKQKEIYIPGENDFEYKINYQCPVIKITDIIYTPTPIKLWQEQKYREAIEMYMAEIPEEDKKFKWMLGNECIKDIGEHIECRSSAEAVLESFAWAITDRRRSKGDQLLIDTPKDHFKTDGWKLYRRHTKLWGFRIKYWIKQRMIFFSAIHQKNESTDFNEDRYLPKKYWPSNGLTPDQFQ
tara:strand:- start:66 stop:1190 length:1125 start_codon:yes stop_codon:yes gene_type:complete